MANNTRPLSPHLQVYRLQLTSVLSFIHRGTGVVLSLGFLALVYWLLAGASGPEAYAAAGAVFGSVPGLVLLAALSFSFFYHLGNGIRHLVWDTGWWLELPQVYASGWVVVILALVSTAAFWTVVLFGAGGTP